MPELGIGWYPVTAQPYDDAYWEKYRRYDASPIGDALTACRLAIVRRYCGDRPVVDVGIGGGRFVQEHGNAQGFDVNPRAVEWLKARKKFFDPYKSEVDSLSFWDSLEHIHNPEGLLRRVQKFVFVSLPIFRDADHVLASKHFRPDEHCWYFTRSGFLIFMARFGFHPIEESTMEQDAGREDIMTFAFARYA